ncbi:MAG: sensor histidine kinase [Acidimicrobiales bacterium]
MAVLALATSAAVAAAGWLVLWRWPRTSLRAQIAVVSLVGTAATVSSVLLAARAMFVSSHDAAAVLVAVITAGLVGVVAAVALAQRVSRASAALGAATGAMGEQAFAVPAVATAELDDLAHRLEETSARLNRARLREQTLERSRRELVAWVSHDLRTPLAGIRAMVEALEDEVVTDPEVVARYYRSMRQEADRLARLVDDLFELSRIEADALQLTCELVSLGDVASDALASAALAAEAKGVRLRGGLVESAPLVEASTVELSRVIRNLLDNAIRWTPAGGEVRVDVGDDGASAYVSVVDGCGGIPDADLDRVFEPAFRGDPARTPGTAGAGLGLAIARGLIQAQRGEIDVRNENGGCCFTVRLPQPG